VSSGRLEGILNVLGDDGMVANAGDGHGTTRKGDAVNGLSYFHNASGGGGAVGKYDGLLAVAVGSRRYDDLQSDVDDDGMGRVDNRKRVEENPPGGLQLHGMNILRE
jgi:hypothetical protein